MGDPIQIGTIVGFIAAAVMMFFRIYKIEKKAERQKSEIVETLEAVKAIFGDAGSRTGVPGYGTECFRRATDHGERIRAVETTLNHFGTRFDGLNQKIESVRQEMKQEFADLRREIRAS